MYTAHSLDLFLAEGVMHLNILYFGWDSVMDMSGRLNGRLTNKNG